MFKKVQDIHASDETLWGNFQIYWNSGNYRAALNLLSSNSSLARKYLNAEWLNKLTQYYSDLEVDKDPTFKQDIIKVSVIPVGLNTGEVYFQITFNVSNYAALEYVLIPVGSTTATITLPNNTYMIQYGAFVNQELVQVDVSRKNQIVTFTLAEAIDKTVVCTVFRTKGTGWQRKTDNFTGSALNTSYINNLIGVLYMQRDAQDSSLYHFVELDCTFGNQQITSRQNVAENQIFLEILSHTILTFNSVATIEDYIADVEFFGEILGFLATQGNDKVITDIAQKSNRFEFSINQPVTPQIQCKVAYDNRS